MIGKTLAHYQTISEHGKGGMGEVCQAKDCKLGRDVAIKFLPDEFVKDADGIARFQREAKGLASLNHPNIAASGAGAMIRNSKFEIRNLDNRIFLSISNLESRILHFLSRCKEPSNG
jgi:serine/threonine protein kinase